MKKLLLVGVILLSGCADKKQEKLDELVYWNTENCLNQNKISDRIVAITKSSNTYKIIGLSGNVRHTKDFENYTSKPVNNK